MIDALNADERLRQTGLSLPPPPAPLGVYKPCLIDGKYLYLSGHGPVRDDATLIIGRIGEDMDIEEGKLAARQVGLTMMATIQKHFGALSKIKRVIKVLGMVNCTSDFKRHPYVINGCSELFALVWGDENGIGVRSAVGFGSYPIIYLLKLKLCLSWYNLIYITTSVYFILIVYYTNAWSNERNKLVFDT